MIRKVIMAGLVAALAACGAQEQKQGGDVISENGAPIEDAAEDDAPGFDDIEPVNPALLAAPSSTFMAIEPSEVQVFAESSVERAIAPLIPPETFEEDAAVSMSIREDGDTAWADVVRENIPDDSIAAGHIRIEFRREADGWFPTNAYRRWLCRRGEVANQWSSAPCP